MEEDTEALYPIVTDKAALHICAYSVEEFIHRVFRRQARRKAHDGDDINPTSRLHFQKGVRILRQRLLEGDEASKVSDSTISIVVKLASAAHFDGDEKAARLHMRGLRKMIDLRGGLSNVFVGKRVMVEMLRYH